MIDGEDLPTSSAKRELIDTGTDKRYVRRNPQGEFKETDVVGRSLSEDRRKNKVKSGQEDKGER